MYYSSVYWLYNNKEILILKLLERKEYVRFFFFFSKSNNSNISCTCIIKFYTLVESGYYTVYQKFTIDNLFTQCLKMEFTYVLHDHINLNSIIFGKHLLPRNKFFTRKSWLIGFLYPVETNDTHKHYWL